jgi:hypothetical protein
MEEYRIKDMNEMLMIESKEKGRLLSEALKIIENYLKITLQIQI